MTREEAMAFLQGRIDLIDKYYPQIEDYRDALDIAIKALEQEPCEDVVSRQSVLNTLDKRFDSIPVGQTTEILLLRKDLRELPPATLTQKKGKWEQYGDFWKEKYRCSECKEEQPKILCGEQIIGHWSDYCPNCGAKMVENEEDKELIVNKDVYDTLTEEQKKLVDIGLSYFNNNNRKR